MAEPISQSSNGVATAGIALPPHTKNEPNLMGLPVEVRRQILRELLVVDPDHDWAIPGLWKEHRSKPEVPGFDISSAKRKFNGDNNIRFHRDLLMCRHGEFNLHVEILRTCKQLHLEGTSVLLGENEFVAMIGLGGVQRWLGHLGLCITRNPAKSCRQVLRRPPWKWDENRVNFATPSGWYGPIMTVDWGCGERDQVVILSVAELRGIATRIRMIIGRYHLFWQHASTEEHLPRPTEPRILLQANPIEKALKWLDGVPAVDFLEENFIGSIRVLGTQWQVGIGEHTRAERSVRQAWRDVQAKQEMVTRARWWHREIEPKIREPMIVQFVWHKFELLKKKLNSNNTKEALLCLQDLLRQGYDEEQQWTDSMSMRQVAQIAALGRYLVLMQPDCGGFFESDMAFMQWAVLNLMDQDLVSAFDGGKWKKWIHIRLSELFLHMGNSERVINSMVEVGVQFASFHTQISSQREWARRQVRKQVLMTPARCRKLVKGWKFNTAQKQRASSLIQEWRDKAGLMLEELMKITLDDIKAGAF